jgi:hypothetical protein
METMIGQQEAYVGWAAGVHLVSIGALCVSVFMLAMVSGWMDESRWEEVGEGARLLFSWAVRLSAVPELSHDLSLSIDFCAQ